jgi:hypothetical protein
MRRAGALLVLLTLAATSATSATPAAPAELTPVVWEHTLGVHITGIVWPATLTKDLVSGLTNTLLIHAALLGDSRQLDQKTAVIAIKYDLWEETFALTVRVNGAVILARTEQRRSQIEAFLADLAVPELFPTSELPKDGTATLRVEMLLNPIERERLEAIRKWVIENDTSIPADTSGFNDKRVGTSRSNEVFNKIFEQYAEGADAAASWKESLSSTPFKISELGR